MMKKTFFFEKQKEIKDLKTNSNPLSIKQQESIQRIYISFSQS